MQVQSHCLYLLVEIVAQYISELHSALRLSALSLQMASQLAALTLSLPKLCHQGARYHPVPRPLCQSARASLLTPPTLMGTFTSIMSKWHRMDTESLMPSQRQFFPRHFD